MPNEDASRPRIEAFVNCSFSPQLRGIFDAIVYALLYCGITPVLAPSRLGHGIPRLEFIMELLERCDLFVCDLSQVIGSQGQHLLNTSFELGLVLGRGRGPDCLIFSESERGLLEILTDLRGHDIDEHGGDGAVLVRKLTIALRKRERAGLKSLPMLNDAARAYDGFHKSFDNYCQLHGLELDDDLSYRVSLIAKWIIEYNAK